MKRILIITLALLMLCFAAACGQNKADASVGSWSITESTEMTAEAQKAFDKAIEGLMGVNYSPVALLGTQLVSGTNYCVLAYGSLVTADPVTGLIYRASVRACIFVTDLLPVAAVPLGVISVQKTRHLYCKLIFFIIPLFHGLFSLLFCSVTCYVDDRDLH